MNNYKTAKAGFACPPLATDDIVMLRGKPAAKWFKPKKDFGPVSEEWIYILPQTNSKEHYFFKNGCLTGWRRNKYKGPAPFR
ncbi:MAG: hypothetical protein HY811_06355 [Planctomycetes bacterium]|nr:hypothetical protein [Planctomycetota bacterium]